MNRSAVKKAPEKQLGKGDLVKAISIVALSVWRNSFHVSSISP
jgi:hypothetical protein